MAVNLSLKSIRLQAGISAMKKNSYIVQIRLTLLSFLWIISIYLERNLERLLYIMLSAPAMATIVVSSLFPPLAMPLAIARYYVRRLKSMAFQADEYLILLALVRPVTSVYFDRDTLEISRFLLLVVAQLTSSVRLTQQSGDIIG